MTKMLSSYHNKNRTIPASSPITRLITNLFSASFILLLSGCAARSILPRLSPTETRVGGPRCDLSTHICGKPTMMLDLTKNYTATIKTAKGDIVITLDAKNSPQTVNNFVYLAMQHYYDGS